MPATALTAQLRSLLLRDALGLLPNASPQVAELDRFLAERHQSSRQRPRVLWMAPFLLAVIAMLAGVSFARAASPMTQPVVIHRAAAPAQANSASLDVPFQPPIQTSVSDAGGRAGIRVRTLAGYPHATLVRSVYHPPVLNGDGTVLGRPAVELDYMIAGISVELNESLDTNPGEPLNLQIKQGSTVVWRTEAIDGGSYLVGRGGEVGRTLIVRWKTPDGMVITLVAIPGGIDDITAKGLLRSLPG